MILGHERQVEYLNKFLRRGKLAHAYLFYGPEHVGKFTVAEHFAGLFNSSEVIILSPEHTLVSKKEKRKDIPIDDIRELKRRLSFAPEGSKWRVVIINEAEKLSDSAADAFLKILEEPGEQTLIILVASSCELLLPTIISRTQSIRFSVVAEETLLKFIKSREESKKKQELILAIAAGRPGIAVRLMEMKDYLTEEMEFLKNINSILQKKEIPEAFRLVEKIVLKEELRDKTVEYVLRILRKNLLESAGTKDIAPLVLKLKKVAEVADIMETTNVNPRLGMDTLFLEACRN